MGTETIFKLSKYNLFRFSGIFNHTYFLFQLSNTMQIHHFYQKIEKSFFPSFSARPKTVCDKKTEFDCGGGMCIPLSKVCDKKPDCPNFEDEPKDRCGENECAKGNGGCSQKCVDMPVGYYCDCENGYKLMDNKTCDGKY